MEPKTQPKKTLKPENLKNSWKIQPGKIPEPKTQPKKFWKQKIRQKKILKAQKIRRKFHLEKSQNQIYPKEIWKSKIRSKKSRSLKIRGGGGIFKKIWGSPKKRRKFHLENAFKRNSGAENSAKKNLKPENLKKYGKNSTMKKSQKPPKKILERAHVLPNMSHGNGPMKLVPRCLSQCTRRENTTIEPVDI